MGQLVNLDIVRRAVLLKLFISEVVIVEEFFVVTQHLIIHGEDLSGHLHAGTQMSQVIVFKEFVTVAIDDFDSIKVFGRNSQADKPRHYVAVHIGIKSPDRHSMVLHGFPLGDLDSVTGGSGSLSGICAKGQFKGHGDILILDLILGQIFKLYRAIYPGDEIRSKIHQQCHCRNKHDDDRGHFFLQGCFL